jgi:uncharacterized damage-inducible protein DinB
MNETASLRSQLIKMTKYNLWANTKISEFLLKLDPALLDKELISSFNTIRKTLYHIMGAESIWLSRLNGISPTRWPGENYSGTDIEAINSFTEQSEKLVSYAESCTEDSIQDIVKYSSLDGIKFENTKCDILHHVINHSTFHRGQLITMLRNVGYTDLSSTDYIQYLREGN